jgi:hypothetical protein
MGATEGQVCAKEGGLETQGHESGHAEEVVSDDEGTVGSEEKREGIVQVSVSVSGR